MTDCEAADLQAGRVFYLSTAQPDKPPTMFSDEPDVMDVRKVAELLGVDQKTVRREIARGRLECFRVGSRVRITKKQLIEYVGGGE